MKFFPIVLLLLYTPGLKALTLPQNRPDGGLNTTLLANFSGLYERQNPCNNDKVESSSYVASHEFHHHTKGENWSDYTQKCSDIISNFLKSIISLVRLNSKPDGTFTFHVNTSISQKQASDQDCKCSLPTIIIEATNCVNSENKKPEGLIREGPKEDVSGKANGGRNLKKAFGERATPQGSPASSNRLTGVPKRPVFETTQTTEQENSFLVQNNDDLRPRQGHGNTRLQYPNEYITEEPRMTTVEAFKSQTDAIDHVAVDSIERPNLDWGNQPEAISPMEPFETVSDQEISSSVSQPSLPSNGGNTEGPDFILPSISINQQPSVPLYIPQLPQGDSYPSTTPVTPTNTAKSIEDIVEYDSVKSETLNGDNASQKYPFYSGISPTVQPVQSADSLDYLEKQNDNIPEISDSATGLPEYRSTVDRYEQDSITTVLPPEKEFAMVQQSDILSNASAASSETLSPGLRPQFDSTQPLEGFGAPVPDVNEAQSYSKLETNLTSSEKQSQTELYSDGPYYTTPKSPPAFPVELSGLETSSPAGTYKFPSQGPVTSDVNKNTQPGQNIPSTPLVLNSFQTTTPLIEPAESLVKSNQETQQEGTTELPLPTTSVQYQEEITDQFQSTDQIYEQFTETPSDSSQIVPEAPVYTKMVINPPTDSSQLETVLEEGNTQDYLPATSQPNFNPFNNNQQVADTRGGSASELPQSYDETPTEMLTFGTGRQDQLANFNEQSKNRQPVTEPTTDALTITSTPFSSTSSPQRKVILEEEILTTTESPLREASQVKPDFYPSQIQNYGGVGPVQFAPEASDNAESDIPTIVSSAVTTSVPESVTSESTLSQQQLTDYDVPIEPFNNGDSTVKEQPLEGTTIPYPESNPDISTIYESDSQKNEQLGALPTASYESYTTTAPQSVEPMPEFKSDVEETSENYSKQSNIPTTAAPDYETDYGRNFETVTTDYPTTVPIESRPETEVGDISPESINSADQVAEPLSSAQDKMSEEAYLSESVANFSKSLDATPTLPGTSESSSIPEVQSYRGQFPITIQPQSGATEKISDSDAYSQISSTSSSVSQGVVQDIAYRPDSALPVGSQSGKTTASRESYYSNRERDDFVSSQDARTQIPQPQPSLDYSNQLPDNERELNTASTDLQTSTFEGSEPNLHPVTYSPLPSVPSKTRTFTTETYENDEVAVGPTPLQVQPGSIASSAKSLSGAESSTFFSQPPQNFETLDTATPTYNHQLAPNTPPPPLTAVEEPPFVRTNLPALDTYSTPDAFIQDVSTTPQPQLVKYDREVVTIDSQKTSPSPVTLSLVGPSQFLNERKGQGFVDRNQPEGQLLRPDTFRQGFDNSDQALRVMRRPVINQDTRASSFPLSQQSTSPQQFVGRNATLPYEGMSRPQDLNLSPLGAKTTSNDVITSTQASSTGYSQRLPNEGFERRYFPNSPIPQPSRQFYTENRHYPPQRYPPQFDNGPYGNYQQPLGFNPQSPRPIPNHFENFPREQFNRFPSNFQRNQFDPPIPVNNHFQPGLDYIQRERMFPNGNGYFPIDRPNYSYNLPPRPGMSPEPRFSPPFQRVFDERHTQYQSYQPDGRFVDGNPNAQMIATPYVQNYESAPYWFSHNYQPSDRFYPDQVRYNQMMPPFRNQPEGYFNPNTPYRPFLNNSNQQVEDRYQPPYDPRANPIQGMKRHGQIDINQGSSEVIADYEEAASRLAPGERIVKFDEEVITVSPKPMSETTLTELRKQRQNADAYSRYRNRQETGSLLESSNRTASSPEGQFQPLGAPPQQGNPLSHALDLPLPNSPPAQNHPQQPTDSFRPQRPSSLPNFSNQFKGTSPDIQPQSFVNPPYPNGGSGVGYTSQSDSYALGPDQVAPSSEPDPTSSRRFDIPSSYRKPVARPFAAPETFSSG